MAGLKADNELRLRTLSSIAIVLVILWGINSGGLIWTVIAGLIALASLNEYYNLAGKIKGTRISPGVGYIFSLAFIIAAERQNPQPIVLGMILSLCVCSVFIVEIARRQMTRGISYAIVNAGAVISGVLYITVPWTCMIVLRDYAFPVYMGVRCRSVHRRKDVRDDKAVQICQSGQNRSGLHRRNNRQSYRKCRSNIFLCAACVPVNIDRFHLRNLRAGR